MQVEHATRNDPGTATGTLWAPWRAATAGAVSALGWLVLSSSEAASLIVGIPSVAFAALVAARVGRAAAGPQARTGADRAALSVVVPLFLFRLLTDVFSSSWSLALQVFRRSLRIDPGLVEYELSLASPEARAAFMNSVTLTPGTLSGTLDGAVVTVHALDRGSRVVPELERLEARIARLYGESLESRT